MPIKERFVSRFSYRIFLTGAVSALALSGVVLSGATPVSAQAMSTTRGAVQNISLDFQNASVQSVLRTLFTRAGKNVSVDPDVQGTVNVTLADVSFDTALRTLMTASNPPLTYDVHDGVYHIQVKPTVPTETSAPAAPPAPANVAAEEVHSYRLPIDSYDAGYLAAMIEPRTAVTLVTPNYVNPAGGAGSASANGNGRNTSGRGGRNTSGRGGRNRGGRRSPGG